MVMSVATGVDVDVMGAKTLNVGGGDYIEEIGNHENPEPKGNIQFDKNANQRKWAGCGNECAHYWE
jgi:hypothetical protein